jgi:flagella basal body P-ring formation protein FlgA
LTLALAVCAGAPPAALRAQVGGRPADAGTLDEEVRSAIVAAVGSRMGPGVDVDVVSLEDIRVAAHAGALVATPDQSAREGRVSRFTMSSASAGGASTRLGDAGAVVRVTADIVRARHALPRGVVVQVGDIEAARAQLQGVAFTRLPAPDDVVGARTTRSIVAGATMTRIDITPEPAVRTGDQVRIVVRIPGVEVASTAVAIQTGARDEIIRVVNPETRRTMRARVTGDKEVEVVYER